MEIYNGRGELLVSIPIKDKRIHSSCCDVCNFYDYCSKDLLMFGNDTFISAVCEDLLEIALDIEDGKALYNSLRGRIIKKIVRK